MIRALHGDPLARGQTHPASHERSGYRFGLICMGLCGTLSVALPELATSLAMPPILIVASGIAAALSLMPSRSATRGVLPHWLIVTISLCGFAWATHEIRVLGTPTVLGLAHFFSLIVIVKWLDRDGARDNAELLVTSLFLMVIGAIISGHLLYALFLGIYVWIGMDVLFQFHLKCESERIAELKTGTNAAITVFAGERRSAADRNTGLSLFAKTAVTTIGILVFVLVPRVGVGMLGKLQSPIAMAMTGFSENADFGDMSEIKTSSAAVMRVELMVDGESVGSPSFQPYLRGMTLDIYDGRRWHAAGNVPLRNVGDDRPLISDYEPGPRDRVLEQRIKLLAPRTQYLFAAYMPYEIELDGKREVQSRSSDRALMVKGSRAVDPMTTYTVRSLTRITPELARELNPDSGPLPAWSRRLPNQSLGRRSAQFDLRRVTSKRLRDHADALLADLPLPTDSESTQAVAQRIKSYLLSGEFAYTLERDDVTPGREPVEDFLFYRKRGHCEYFAAAMTLMCQLSGVNARIVHGYHGGEWNATGRYYTVREEHAHSWVEVYTGAEDWLRYDPTPGGVNVAYDSQSIWSTARGMFDHVNAMWADNVVAYSATSRDSLLDAFGSWLNDLGKQGNVGREIYYAARELLLGPAALNLGYRLMYWISIALIGLVFYLMFSLSKRPVRLWWRWIARAVTRKKRRARQEGFYARTLDLLAEMGFPKKNSTTPLEFMSGLADSDARFVRLPDVARAFYQIHFGGRPLEPEQRRKVARVISELVEVSRLR